jgi:hypothetical protein
MNNTLNSASSGRLTYQVVFRPERSQGADADARHVRQLLKMLLRRYGFRCLTITEAKP